jgi:hypothetical protein
VGPYRLIPIEKPYFLDVQKNPRGDVRGNTLDSIRTILTGGKTPLGYCFKTPFAQECLKCLSCPIYHLNYICYICVLPI